MLKNKLDYKLVNLSLIMVIIYLICKLDNVWMGVSNKILTVITPFFFAFIIAYSLHPYLRFLEKKGIPKAIAMFIVFGTFLGLIGFTLFLITPMLFNQIVSLFNGISAFLTQLTVEYDINFGSFQETLNSTLNEIIVKLGKMISDGAFSVISVSICYITLIFIIFSSSIYFLNDMDKIRENVGNRLYRKNKKTYNYVKQVDIAMKNYLVGFLKIVIISLFEYSFVFLVIGHPNAILLGFLAAVAGIIPYFGGMFANIIAAITAFVISPELFIRTLIAFVVLSNVDGYVINPMVYGKTNEIHPLITIIAVFSGGILMGIPGIILSLPIAIIIVTTIKFYREDISDKITNIKTSKEEN